MFRLRSIDRLPERPSPAAVRGSLVHRALEWLFTEPAEDRTRSAAQALLGQAWTELMSTEPESAQALLEDAEVHGRTVDGELHAGQGTTSAAIAERVLAPALPLLDAYFAMENPSLLEPHARELAVSAEVGDGLTIRGFVDRVDRSPSGEVRIVDYKTGRAPRAGFESKAMFQMRFYALTWWRMTSEVPRALLLLYLGDRQALRYQPEPADLEATERKVLAIRDAISTAAQTGTFAAKPSKLCDWCSFQALCPTRGGLTPPMPSLP